MSAKIMVTITAIYTPKEGVGMDEAVRLVSTNLNKLMEFAGIKNGKQVGDPRELVIPIFCPPPVAVLVDLDIVKPLIVVTPGEGNS